jgi:hypothetical protein
MPRRDGVVAICQYACGFQTELSNRRVAKRSTSPYAVSRSEFRRDATTRSAHLSGDSLPCVPGVLRVGAPGQPSKNQNVGASLNGRPIWPRIV